jgi:hypothetical protein
VINPIEEAQKLYDKDSTRSFGEDLAFYLSKGYVYSGGDFFIMGRPIRKEDDGFVLDYSFSFSDADTWFVHLASGKNSLRRFLDIAPFPLEWVCWHKNKSDKKELNYYKWETYKDKVE